MKKRYVPEKKKKSVPPEGLAWFWNLVKEASGKFPVRFVIETADGSSIHVDITDGEMKVNGSVMYDAAALSFISRTKEDFERLFMMAAKPHDTDNRLMGDIYIAQIADTAWIEKTNAVMAFYDGTVPRTLTIGRKGEYPCFTLDGSPLTQEQGREFIREHYSQFITGYKKAIKGMRQDVIQKKKKSPPETLKSHITEDGKLIVDIDGFLGKAGPREKDGKKESLGEQMLKRRFRGYVESSPSAENGSTGKI